MLHSSIELLDCTVLLTLNHLLLQLLPDVRDGGLLGLGQRSYHRILGCVSFLLHGVPFIFLFFLGKDLHVPVHNFDCLAAPG